MKRSLWFPLWLLLFFAPSIASADAVQGKLNEEIWYLDTEVAVTGTNLTGPNPSKSLLCFAPEGAIEQRVCFPKGHQNIHQWTTTAIVFIPPKNVPPRGVIVLVHPYIDEECSIVRGDRICSKVQKKDYISIAHYKAHPHIRELLDVESGTPPFQLSPEREYEIRGYRFGAEGKGVYLGSWMADKTDIVRWTYDTIRFRPSRMYSDMNAIRVHNGAGLGNEWNLGEIYEEHQRRKRTEQKNEEQQAILSDPILASLTEPISLRNGSGNLVTPFTDVHLNDPALPAFTWAHLSNVVNGYEDGTLRPDRAVNRAEFLKLVYRTKNEELRVQNGAPVQFPDVDPQAWYASYVIAAFRESLVKGYPDGNFRPDQPVRISEALKIAYRLFQIPTSDPSGSEWYSRYMEHAQKNEILYGHPQPEDVASRREILWMLWKLQQYLLKSGS